MSASSAVERIIEEARDDANQWTTSKGGFGVMARKWGFPKAVALQLVATVAWVLNHQVTKRPWRNDPEMQASITIARHAVGQLYDMMLHRFWDLDPRK